MVVVFLLRLNSQPNRLPMETERHFFATDSQIRLYSICESAANRRFNCSTIKTVFLSRWGEWFWKFATGISKQAAVYLSRKTCSGREQPYYLIQTSDAVISFLKLGILVFLLRLRSRKHKWNFWTNNTFYHRFADYLLTVSNLRSCCHQEKRMHHQLWKPSF